ncbi:MAG: FAD-dependent oxidoreductase [Pyrinomonadaceae bacterium]
MPTTSPQYDVIIIGGGPAGLSAALWCADLGLKAILLERESEFGGQLLRTFNRIQNYPGIEDATGVDIRDRFLGQVKKTSVERRSGVAISRVDLAGRALEFEDGSMLESKAIIIATGVRRRKLGVPGEDKFGGHGVLDSGVRNRNNLSGKSVVIVGGGDAALENAIILGETAASVTLVHRSGEFRARSEFLEKAAAMPNVTLVPNRVVTAILGCENVTGIELRDAKTSESSQLSADAMLIRIGVAPNNELFHGQLAVDENGYIKVDSTCATNIEDVFAIGDVANPIAPTICSAAGMGATAAKAAANCL